jgi:serine protease AprX
MQESSRFNLPAKLYAEAVVRSASGESLLRTNQLITCDNVDLFHALPEDLATAKAGLEAAGFEVLNVGQSSINIAAPPAVYEQALGTSLEVIERPVMKDIGQRGMADFINSVDPAPLGEIDVSNTKFQTLLDGIAINEPAYFLQQAIPRATPPSTSTRYLQVPHDLAIELGATQAHRQGVTGKGVKVVIVDTGCYADHPFFKANNYNLNVVLGPGSTNSMVDVSGHGTGVAANVLAIAPEVDLTVLKSDIALANKSRNVNSAAAFRQAVALKPDIISCSWGSDLHSPYELSAFHKVLAAAIADAVRQGIVVVFAAGNGQWAFPAQHPDVIAVGGVFKHLEGSLKGRVEASNYASSFISAIYPNRRVPDVCGLVGRLPNAAYIMLPVPPGSDLDRSLSNVDETQECDGWAAFSGTSSAAPQLAGACALLEQLVPGLGPLKTKQILQETAIDIIEGNSNPASGSGRARAGPDLATGYGLAVAYEAVKSAKCKNKNISLDILSGAKPEKERKAKKLSSISQELSHEEGFNVMNLDDAIFQKLTSKIDEIELYLNDCFRRHKRYKEEFSENGVQIAITINNFIEKSPDLDAERVLIDQINSIYDQKKEKIVISKIREYHVFAAESLIRRGKFIELSKKIIVEAIKLKDKGKETKYYIDGEELPIEKLPGLMIRTLGESLIVEGLDETFEDDDWKADKVKNKILREEVICNESIANRAIVALREFESETSIVISEPASFIDEDNNFTPLNQILIPNGQQTLKLQATLVQGTTNRYRINPEIPLYGGRIYECVSYNSNQAAYDMCRPIT